MPKMEIAMDVSSSMKPNGSKYMAKKQPTTATATTIATIFANLLFDHTEYITAITLQPPLLISICGVQCTLSFKCAVYTHIAH